MLTPEDEKNIREIALTILSLHLHMPVASLKTIIPHVEVATNGNIYCVRFFYCLDNIQINIGNIKDHTVCVRISCRSVQGTSFMRRIIDDMYLSFTLLIEEGMEIGRSIRYVFDDQEFGQVKPFTP